MVCSHFSPNPFKKDICKNCQKGKASHANVSVMVSASPPCSNFKANPFKNDLCATCQQSKHLHNEDKRVVPNAVQISSLEESNLVVCTEYKEHAFKRDVCLNCGKRKESHSFLRSTVARYVDPVLISPREKMTKTFHEQLVPDCDSTKAISFDIKQSAANELYQNTSASQNLDVSQKQESATVMCSDFREHAFRRNYCVNCGKLREFHEVSLQKSSPSINTETYASGKPLCNLENEAKTACIQLLAYETVLPEVKSNAVSEDPSVGDDKSGKQGIQNVLTAVCSDFREHAFRRNYCVSCGKLKEFHNNVAEVGLDTHKETLAGACLINDIYVEKSSESENEIIVKESPVRLPPKVPLAGTADDESSSESENEIIVKESPVRLPRKVPLSRIADDESSSESESEIIVKVTPVRLSPKVPLSRIADDKKSSESENEVNVKESPTRLTPKVPLAKTADDENGDSELILSTNLQRTRVPKDLFE
ncbi:uncharacterized protein TM35_000401840 [Trypanosoma theileri]|uniref:Uncharacterized protein n=1 Tax=Trypanosoma theileri TaxID=67003 RepID=A0A1X0NJT9_9TRYP|nr:uncharacterized protein TM35_000401840 [Trypanosoma theileri]ORC84917.1 hypothetical protein TM35_000401840 [Trypanosoma theileri]